MVVDGEGGGTSTAISIAAARAAAIDFGARGLSGRTSSRSSVFSSDLVSSPSSDQAEIIIRVQMNVTASAACTYAGICLCLRLALSGRATTVVAYLVGKECDDAHPEHNIVGRKRCNSGSSGHGRKKGIEEKIKIINNRRFVVDEKKKGRTRCASQVQGL